MGRRGGSQRWVRPVTHRKPNAAQPRRSSRPRRDSPAVEARAQPAGGGGEQPTDHGRLGAQAAQGVRGQPPVRGGGRPDRAEHECRSRPATDSTAGNKQRESRASRLPRAQATDRRRAGTRLDRGAARTGADAGHAGGPGDGAGIDEARRRRGRCRKSRG